MRILVFLLVLAMVVGTGTAADVEYGADGLPVLVRSADALAKVTSVWQAKARLASVSLYGSKVEEVI